MAVDRKQLKAFANKGVPGGGAHGGPPPTKQDKSSTGAKPPMDTNEGDDDRFADLLPLLEKNAKEFEKVPERHKIQTSELICS